MIKKIVHKIRHKVWLHKLNSSLISEEDKLYNAMILALIFGIIITIGTLLFLRPPPEYFTEIYFTNPQNLPQFIEPASNHDFNLTIANHESSSRNYNLSVFAEIGNQTIRMYTDSVLVEKELTTNLTLSFNLPDYRKAKIVAALPDKNQEVHFFVYNPTYVMKYPEGLAYTDCLNETTITPEDSFMISAKGTFSPNMKVRLDGKEVFSTVVANTDYQNYTIYHPIADNVLDIIMDNDNYNKTTGADTNLYIQSVTIGNITLYPKNFTGDSGKALTMFNCEDLKPVSYGLPWNGALIKLNIK